MNVTIKEVEIKGGVRHVTYYMNRPKQKDDIVSRTLSKYIDGVDVPFEIIKYVYKELDEPNIMQYPLTPEETYDPV